MVAPTELTAWEALREHKKAAESMRLRDLFKQDNQRADAFSEEACGLHIDFSRNRVNKETFGHLFDLARESGLESAIQSMFDGETINNTEHRAVLHTALRNRSERAIELDGEDVMPMVRDTLKRMRRFVDDVHSGAFKGHTGKKLRTIVNIGIGGSFLGPKVVSDALRPYWQEGYDLRYVANIDGNDLAAATRDLDPETTLFVVCSKSFSTLETLKNAQAAREWFFQHGGRQQDVQHHFIAVSTNIKAATGFGIAEDNIFPMWDWVGGRYSLWSAIGLPQAIVLGMDHFERLLDGAHDMDEHFRTTPVSSNLPVIMGLLGIWYQNFWGAESQAVLVYDETLKEFPAHLQQMDMESNGKRVTRDGQPVTWQTGAVVWGGTGTNGQHAYHQLLHQGTRLIPADFIMPLRSHNPISDHHEWLFANFLGQQMALLDGKTEQEVKAELVAKGMSEGDAAALAPHKVIPGNQPHNAITFNTLTPEILGALIALYEHKVFVQGHIWGINSFDQWGVELGKVLGNAVFDVLEKGNLKDFDASTTAMIQRFRNAR